MAILCVFCVGCTTIDHSNIPFCREINETGINCHSPEDWVWGEKIDYKWNESICKGYEFYGTDERLKFCFNTIERYNLDYEEQQKNYTCIKDYDNLNYTTLNISREDFEKLECYRQIDWLNGWCFPSECKARNPPVCTSTYMVMCYNPDSAKSKYFNNIYINKSKEG